MTPVLLIAQRASVGWICCVGLPVELGKAGELLGAGPRKRRRLSAQALRHAGSFGPASPSVWQRKSSSRRGSDADAAAVSAGCTGGLSFSVISIAAAVVAIATKTTAPRRARVLESMVVPSVSNGEEHSVIDRLVAGPGREKGKALVASLPGRGRASE